MSEFGNSNFFDPGSERNRRISAIQQGVAKTILEGTEYPDAQIQTLSQFMTDIHILKWMIARKLANKPNTGEFSKWNEAATRQLKRAEGSNLLIREREELAELKVSIGFDSIYSPVLATDQGIPDVALPTRLVTEKEKAEAHDDWRGQGFVHLIDAEEVDDVKDGPGYRRALNILYGHDGGSTTEQLKSRVYLAKGIFDPNIPMGRMSLIVLDEEICVAAKIIADDLSTPPVEALADALEFAKTHASSEQSLTQIRGILDKKVVARAISCRAGQSGQAGLYGDPERDSEALITIFASTPERAADMTDYLRNYGEEQ